VIEPRYFFDDRDARCAAQFPRYRGALARDPA
jgi:hypothetical protein